jgi:putative ABC transport system substrate-binding protein
MVPRQIQLLREMIPGLQRVAFLGSTEDKATPIFVQQATSAAAALGVKLQVALIGQASEFESAASAMERDGAQAVVVQPLFTLGSSAALGDVLARHKLPSISALRPYALAGGLSSYGANRADQWRRAASFIDRVLKGARPASLPVEEPTTYELVFNLKTAKAIGLVIPPGLLQRADEVIL